MSSQHNVDLHIPSKPPFRWQAGTGGGGGGGALVVVHWDRVQCPVVPFKDWAGGESKSVNLKGEIYSDFDWVFLQNKQQAV